MTDSCFKCSVCSNDDETTWLLPDKQQKNKTKSRVKKSINQSKINISIKSSDIRVWTKLQLSCVRCLNRKSSAGVFLHQRGSVFPCAQQGSSPLTTSTYSVTTSLQQELWSEALPFTPCTRRPRRDKRGKRSDGGEGCKNKNLNFIKATLVGSDFSAPACTYTC